MGNVPEGSVAQRLADTLRRVGRSQNWLAGQVGIPQSTLNRQMKDGTLSAETVARAARALGADVGWLLTGDAEPGEAAQPGGGREAPATDRAEGGEREYDWTALVDAALATCREKTNAEAAAFLAVSEGTVQRWRTARDVGMEIPEPRGAPREALLRLVDVKNGRKELLRGRAKAGVPPDEIGERLDGIEALPIEERLKILKIAEVAAAYRSAALYEAEVAARIRAEALREAERAGMVRSEAVGKESESAHARTLSLQNQPPSESDEEAFRRLVRAAEKLPQEARDRLAQQVASIRKQTG